MLNNKDQQAKKFRKIPLNSIFYSIYIFFFIPITVYWSFCSRLPDVFGEVSKLFYFAVLEAYLFIILCLHVVFLYRS